MFGAYSQRDAGPSCDLASAEQKSAAQSLSSQLHCWLSEAEQEGFEALVEQTGVKCFLCRDQLEDIRANLERSILNFTPEQFNAAINFYWKHDAFIDFSLKP